jgi:hypothetical protein
MTMCGDLSCPKKYQSHHDADSETRKRGAFPCHYGLPCSDWSKLELPTPPDLVSNSQVVTIRYIHGYPQVIDMLGERGSW